MKITTDVILDLLPLYMADEVSADTRALIEEYLETDPQLMRLVKQSAALELWPEVQVPLNQDDRMRIFRQAKRSFFMRTIILSGAISLPLLILILFLFFSSS